MQDIGAAARPRRVLMIAPTSFFADYGCHVRIYEQARGLTARGHQVLLCTYHSGRDVPGLSIVRTPALPWRRRIEIGASWHRLLLDGLLLCTAWRAARRQQPEIIHAFLHEGAFMGTLISRLLHVPLLADLQGSLSSEMVEHEIFPPEHRILGLLRRLESWISRQPAQLLANTHHTARWLTEDFGMEPARVRVVPDVVDTERFMPGRLPAEGRQSRRQALGIPPDGFLLVYVGLLAPYQGIDMLLH
ncbi:MAG: glycosyltransferase, partial [Anaerolineae bacterium]